MNWIRKQLEIQTWSSHDRRSEFHYSKYKSHLPVESFSGLESGDAIHHLWTCFVEHRKESMMTALPHLLLFCDAVARPFLPLDLKGFYAGLTEQIIRQDKPTLPLAFDFPSPCWIAVSEALYCQMQRLKSLHRPSTPMEDKPKKKAFILFSGSKKSLSSPPSSSTSPTHPPVSSSIDVLRAEALAADLGSLSMQGRLLSLLHDARALLLTVYVLLFKETPSAKEISHLFSSGLVVSLIQYLNALLYEQQAIQMGLLATGLTAAESMECQVQLDEQAGLVCYLLYHVTDMMPQPRALQKYCGTKKHFLSLLSTLKGTLDVIAAYLRQWADVEAKSCSCYAVLNLSTLLLRQLFTCLPESRAFILEFMFLDELRAVWESAKQVAGSGPSLFGWAKQAIESCWFACILDPHLFLHFENGLSSEYHYKLLRWTRSMIDWMLSASSSEPISMSPVSMATSILYDLFEAISNAHQLHLEALRGPETLSRRNRSPFGQTLAAPAAATAVVVDWLSIEEYYTKRWASLLSILLDTSHSSLQGSSFEVVRQSSFVSLSLPSSTPSLICVNGAEQESEGENENEKKEDSDTSVVQFILALLRQVLEAPMTTILNAPRSTPLFPYLVSLILVQFERVGLYALLFSHGYYKGGTLECQMRIFGLLDTVAEYYVRSLVLEASASDPGRWIDMLVVILRGLHSEPDPSALINPILQWLVRVVLEWPAFGPVLTASTSWTVYLTEGLNATSDAAARTASPTTLSILCRLSMVTLRSLKPHQLEEQFIDRAFCMNWLFDPQASWWWYSARAFVRFQFYETTRILFHYLSNHTLSLLLREEPIESTEKLYDCCLRLLNLQKSFAFLVKSMHGASSSSLCSQGPEQDVGDSYVAVLLDWTRFTTGLILLQPTDRSKRLLQKAMVDCNYLEVSIDLMLDSFEYASLVTFDLLKQLLDSLSLFVSVLVSHNALALRYWSGYARVHERFEEVLSCAQRRDSRVHACLLQAYLAMLTERPCRAFTECLWSLYVRLSEADKKAMAEWLTVARSSRLFEDAQFCYDLADSGLTRLWLDECLEVSTACPELVTLLGRLYRMHLPLPEFHMLLRSLTLLSSSASSRHRSSVAMQLASAAATPIMDHFGCLGGVESFFMLPAREDPHEPQSSFVVTWKESKDEKESSVLSKRGLTVHFWAFMYQMARGHDEGSTAPKGSVEMRCLLHIPLLRFGTTERESGVLEDGISLCVEIETATGMPQLVLDYSHGHGHSSSGVKSKDGRQWSTRLSSSILEAWHMVTLQVLPLKRLLAPVTEMKLQVLLDGQMVIETEALDMVAQWKAMVKPFHFFSFGERVSSMLSLPKNMPGSDLLQALCRHVYYSRQDTESDSPIENCIYLFSEKQAQGLASSGHGHGSGPGLSLLIRSVTLSTCTGRGSGSGSGGGTVAGGSGASNNNVSHGGGSGHSHAEWIKAFLPASSASSSGSKKKNALHELVALGPVAWPGYMLLNVDNSAPDGESGAHELRSDDHVGRSCFLFVAPSESTHEAMASFHCRPFLRRTLWPSLLTSYGGPILLLPALESVLSLDTDEPVAPAALLGLMSLALRSLSSSASASRQWTVALARAASFKPFLMVLESLLYHATSRSLTIELYDWLVGLYDVYSKDTEFCCESVDFSIHDFQARLLFNPSVWSKAQETSTLTHLIHYMALLQEKMLLSPRLVLSWLTLPLFSYAQPLHEDRGTVEKRGFLRGMLLDIVFQSLVASHETLSPDTAEDVSCSSHVTDESAQLVFYHLVVSGVLEDQKGYLRVLLGWMDALSEHRGSPKSTLSNQSCAHPPPAVKCRVRRLPWSLLFHFLFRIDEDEIRRDSLRLLSLLLALFPGQEVEKDDGQDFASSLISSLVWTLVQVFVVKVDAVFCHALVNLLSSHGTHILFPLLWSRALNAVAGEAAKSKLRGASHDGFMEWMKVTLHALCSNASMQVASTATDTEPAVQVDRVDWERQVLGLAECPYWIIPLARVAVQTEPEALSDGILRSGLAFDVLLQFGQSLFCCCFSLSSPSSSSLTRVMEDYFAFCFILLKHVHVPKATELLHRLLLGFFENLESERIRSDKWSSSQRVAFAKIQRLTYHVVFFRDQLVAAIDPALVSLSESETGPETEHGSFDLDQCQLQLCLLSSEWTLDSPSPELVPLGLHQSLYAAYLSSESGSVAVLERAIGLLRGLSLCIGTSRQRQRVLSQMLQKISMHAQGSHEQSSILLFLNELDQMEGMLEETESRRGSTSDVASSSSACRQALLSLELAERLGVPFQSQIRSFHHLAQRVIADFKSASESDAEAMINSVSVLERFDVLIALSRRALKKALQRAPQTESIWCSFIESACGPDGYCRHRPSRSSICVGLDAVPDPLLLAPVDGTDTEASAPTLESEFYWQLEPIENRSGVRKRLGRLASSWHSPEARDRGAESDGDLVSYMLVDDDKDALYYFLFPESEWTVLGVKSGAVEPLPHFVDVSVDSETVRVHTEDRHSHGHGQEEGNDLVRPSALVQDWYTPHRPPYFMSWPRAGRKSKSSHRFFMSKSNESEYTTECSIVCFLSLLKGKLTLDAGQLHFEPLVEPQLEKAWSLGSSESRQSRTHGHLPRRNESPIVPFHSLTTASQDTPSPNAGLHRTGFAATPPPFPSSYPYHASYRDKSMPRSYLLCKIRCIESRRYLYVPLALEFFFTDGTSELFVFPDEKKRSQFIQKLHARLSSEPRWSDLIHTLAQSPKENFRSAAAASLTDDWVHRRICNFDYLMALNRLACRSMNDLTQYPVMPWTLNDYTSLTLSLSDPAIYRDLSKPIGALNPERLAVFLERYWNYEELHGRSAIKFHYGTHYSSPAGVLYYLLRLEPYTSLHIALQGGKMDVPDRLFHSLSTAWHNALHSSSDVKELIPEFYSNPEFLRLPNPALSSLGRCQDGRMVGDVELPPWAMGSPETFVRVHRAALESEPVSAMLHAWIDLIFGYRARGLPAVQSSNTFYYLTYDELARASLSANSLAGASSPSSLNGLAEERASLETQILYFGQTPAQLLDTPHPRRKSLEEMGWALVPGLTLGIATNYLASCESMLMDHLSHGRRRWLQLEGFSAIRQAWYFPPSLVQRPTLRALLGAGTAATASRMHRLVVCDAMGFYNMYYLVNMASAAGEETGLPTATAAMEPSLESTYPKANRKLPMTAGPLLCSVIQSEACLFYLHNDMAPHWPVDSIAGAHVESGSPFLLCLYSSCQRGGDADRPTAMALSEGGRYMAVGHERGTLSLYELDVKHRHASVIARSSFHGHPCPITRLAISYEYRMAVSADQEGRVHVYSLFNFQWTATLLPTSERQMPMGSDVLEKAAVLEMMVSRSGHIYILYTLTSATSASELYLSVWTCNGRWLATCPLSRRPYRLLALEHANLLLTVDGSPHLNVYHSTTLELLKMIHYTQPLFYVEALNEDESSFFLAADHGAIILV